MHYDGVAACDETTAESTLTHTLLSSNARVPRSFVTSTFNASQLWQMGGGDGDSWWDLSRAVGRSVYIVHLGMNRSNKFWLSICV